MMNTTRDTSGHGSPASRTFRAGLLHRGPAAPITAALILIVVLGTLNWVFTSGLWTVVPVEYCLRDDDDTSTYVSWTVGRNKRLPPDVPAVYLLGGSSAREALLGGPSLAADIARFGGPTVAAWNVGSSNQDFAETFAIVDNVPDSPTWVIIGVGPGRFTASPAENEQEVVGIGMLTRSDHLKHYVARQYGHYAGAVTILPGVLRYLGGVAGAVLSAGGPVQHDYDPFKYSLDRAYTPAQKDGMVATWFERAYPRFRANVDYNLAMLDEVVACAQERGLHVVIVELPLNRTAVRGRFDAVLSMYRGPVRAIARARRVPYLDLEREAALPSSDFHDLVHLVEPGRARWQRRLARELAALMAADAAQTRAAR
jgi:hypothetical protein